MCGYSYSLKVPETYNENKSYPLIVFLHGGINSDQNTFAYYDRLRDNFYNPENDPYIYAAPIKLEIDWDPNKIRDLIEDIKKNINVDPKRIYLTGLSNVSKDLMEAARLDGAKGLKMLWHVVLPQLRPATFISVVVTIIGALRSFDMVAIMTEGGPYGSSNVLAYYMYETALSEYGYRMGYGSAIATVLFFIIYNCKNTLCCFSIYNFL